VRYLAAKHDKDGVLEPKDAKRRALASQWMDWQLSVAGPAITPAFWGLIRTPAEKRDMTAIKGSQEKTTAAMQILDAQLGKTQFVAGDAFSYGDIPVGVMCYRYRQLVPDRPATPNLDRWYTAIAARKAFHDQVGSIPLS
jgi:glutathione S-transferase